MTFQLLRLEPDTHALAHWATRNRLLSADGDYGYALHALLNAAFGDCAPQPFRYLGGRQGLLAYTSADLEALRLNASLATPDVARALGLATLDARAFPCTWQTGQRVGFEVRVRPVIRSKDGRERDAYLHAVEATVNAEKQAEIGGIAQRSAIYTDWLAKQFAVDAAALIQESQLDSFKLARVLRKGGVNEQGQRKTTPITGPDAVFKGVLQVGDPEGFNRLLARGVGRHRAFGFGMLLLKPARSC